MTDQAHIQAEIGRNILRIPPSKYADIELGKFNEIDVLNIRELYIKSTSYSGARARRIESMMADTMDIRYEGRNPKPELNYIRGEYYVKAVLHADNWLNQFGFIVYCISEVEIPFSETIKASELSGDMDVVIKGKRKRAIVPFVVDETMVSQTMPYRYEGKVGVVVLNKEKNALSKTLKIYVDKRPHWDKMLFDSECAMILPDYVKMREEYIFFERMRIDQTYPTLFFQHTKEMEMDKPDIIRERHNRNLGAIALINKEARENSNKDRDEYEPESSRMNPYTLHEDYKINKKAGLRGDAYRVMQRGLQLSTANTGSVYESNLDRFIERFDQAVALATGVHLAFIRPLISTNKVVSTSQDHVRMLKDAVSLRSKTHVKFIKHVWCVDIHTDHDIDKLGVLFSIPSSSSLGDIAHMYEWGYITGPEAREEALRLTHMHHRDSIVDSTGNIKTRPVPEPPMFRNNGQNGTGKRVKTSAPKMSDTSSEKKPSGEHKQ